MKTKYFLFISIVLLVCSLGLSLQFKTQIYLRLHSIKLFCHQEVTTTPQFEIESTSPFTVPSIRRGSFVNTTVFLSKAGEILIKL